MKRFLFLISILAGASLANASATITALDQANFLEKIQADQLLLGKDGATYAEERNLNKDLQFSGIVDYFDCQTLAGKHFFEKALGLPISPKSTCGTIERRVKIISALMTQPAFKAEVDALLDKAKVAEQTVIELFSGEFRGSACPEEAGLKELKQMNHPMYGFTKFLNTDSNGKLVITGLSMLNIGYSAYSMIKLDRMIYQTIKAAKAANAHFSFKDGAKIASSVATINVLNAGIIAVSGYMLGKDYQNALKKRDKMHGLSDIVVVAERLNDLCQKYNVAPSFMSRDIVNEDSLKIMQELKKSRYAQEEAYLIMAPYVHGFLYDIYEGDKGLADFFACVAEMDVYNAIATKMLEQKDASNKLCFVKLLEHEKPMFEATRFWNVLVGPNAVANDLSESRHIILSGHNAGGKTTAIRALLQNILLGQTFGVAAATEFEFTPFDVIHSYLNISDDLIGGLSLFASEVKRAQEISQKIASLAPGIKFFFALDELFTGTAGEQGEECAIQFIGSISKADQVQFIYATHFDRLKRLGDVSVECTNYHVNSVPKLPNGQYVRLPNGKLDYPFTVSPGASYDNIALEMAKDANLFGSNQGSAAVAA